MTHTSENFWLLVFVFSQFQSKIMIPSKPAHEAMQRISGRKLNGWASYMSRDLNSPTDTASSDWELHILDKNGGDDYRDNVKFSASESQCDARQLVAKYTTDLKTRDALVLVGLKDKIHRPSLQRNLHTINADISCTCEVVTLLQVDR